MPYNMTKYHAQEKIYTNQQLKTKKQAKLVYRNDFQGINILQISGTAHNYYRDNLVVFKHEFGCKIYAYYLMINHVHLVVDPGANPESLSKLMKRMAGRQTRYVNKLEKRTGSIWEGRFKSSVLSAENTYSPVAATSNSTIFPRTISQPHHSQEYSLTV